MKRFNLFVMGVVILVVLLLLGGYYYFLVRPLPMLDGELKIPGLRARVEIIRDKWGIPHIYATNEHDLLVAQGFVQAQDRLWQMDLNRRMAQGRLSEIFGPLTLDADKLLRTFGIHEAASRDLEVCRDEELQALLWFAKGVNAFINLHKTRLPVEFKLLGYTPEPWSPVDSLGWAKMMALSGGRNWEEEVVRMLISQELGPERAATLCRGFRKKIPCTLDFSRKLSSISSRHYISSLFMPVFPAEGGSNNWVVAGRLTETGSPILANDMHLPLRIPSIWYEMHLVGGRYNVMGLSLPGIPLIIAGHNQEVAWGITYAYVDVQDLYLEKAHPQKPDHFLYNGKWIKAQKHLTPIKVKGRERPVDFWVWKTHHGPLISRVVPLLKGLKLNVSLRWSAHDPGINVRSLIKMNLASSVREFSQAARIWCEPAINLVFADRVGHIGYVTGSRIPLRHEGQGPVPSPGEDPVFDWQGWVMPEEKPGLLDPPQGFIATANNCTALKSYPHYLGVDYAPGHRVARIRELISRTVPVSIQDCAKMQGDLKSLPALEFVQAIKRVAQLASSSQGLMRHLEGWDGAMDSGSMGAAIYNVLFQRMLFNTFADELQGLSPLFFGKGLTLLAHMNRFANHSWSALHRLVNTPDSPWFDDVSTPQRETLSHVLQKSLEETAEFLSKELGQDQGEWRWGRLHTMTLEHPLGKVAILGKIFNLGPFEGSGNFHTIKQSAISPGMDFKLKAWDVSNRHIYDLADWDHSIGCIVPGQSAHRASPHYSDQMDTWLRVGHHPLPFTRGAVESSAAHTLLLVP